MAPLLLPPDTWINSHSGVTKIGTHLNSNDGGEQLGVRETPGGARGKNGVRDTPGTARGEQKRKKKKKLNRTNDGLKLVAASQNMRGLTTESDREEIKLQMERQGIHLVCGQETWVHRDTSMQRWDTGELFINCGGQDKRKHEGVCFFLSKEMATMYERGGRQIHKYCSRLATIRLQLRGGKDIYVVNVHAPDSGQSAAKRDAFRQKFERALRAAKTTDVLVVMGDFNASTGIANDEACSEVCGDYGIEHVNEAGTHLKMTAEIHHLRELNTFQEQAFYGTWVHPQSLKWHQLDKVFMRESQRYMVNKCVNGEMLKVSDHFSIRLNLTIASPPRPPFSARQKMNSRNLNDYFHREANDEVRVKKVREIANEYRQNLVIGENEHGTLLAAVQKVLMEIPFKRRERTGWCDVNETCLNDAIEKRNVAARAYAKTKTEEARLELKRERHTLKKLKRVAKNKWMMEQLKDCNNSVLPGRKDRKNPYALWKLATRLKNGLDKWRTWDDSNVRNSAGKMAVTPEENASIFQTFFDDLFSNAEEGHDATAEYAKMEKRKVVRTWGPPTMEEMKEELKHMKHTAAGVSGIPSSVWQACSEDPDLQQGMLRVLRECWVNETVPEEWTKFHMTVLFKKGKKCDVGNYRGISMAETLSKLYTSILKRRLEEQYEALVPEYCNGFRRGRGRMDSIFMLKETLRKRKANGMDSYCIFYDFIKMFDKISRDCIWKSMEVMGIDEKMIKAVQATLEGTVCKMNIGGVEKVVTMKEGSGQGTTLGPTLCNFFLLPILIQFEKDMKAQVTTAAIQEDGKADKVFSTFTHNFADDTCMVLGNLKDATTVAREFNLYTKKFRSRVHVANAAVPKSKSVVVYIPSKTGRSPATNKIPVNADGSEWINFVNSSAYLGSQISANLTDDGEIEGRISKALMMFGSLRKHLLASKNVWNAVKCRIITGMLLPIMLDGAESWVVSAKALQHLHTAYNQVVRGCLRFSLYTTRKHRITTAQMQEKLGVEPLEYYLDWRILGYAGHVARMPAHRLPQMIRVATMAGHAKVGAPPKSHARQISESLTRKGIPRHEWGKLTLDKEKWRNLIKRPVTLVKKTARPIPELWAVSPNLALGSIIEKKFRNKFYEGTVVATDIDIDTNEQIWEVRYDDGDHEDFNARELQRAFSETRPCVTHDRSGMAPSVHGMRMRDRILEYDPGAAIGTTVYKFYGGALYTGQVIDHDTDAATGKCIWGVRYSDGDEADYDISQLRAITELPLK